MAPIAGSSTLMKYEYDYLYELFEIALVPLMKLVLLIVTYLLI